MIKPIALSVLYLLLFYAFALGIKSMADGECSAWLTSCPAAEVATAQSSSNNLRAGSPDNPERL